MSMPVMRCKVVGVSAVGFGYGSEAHQVATVDIRRASRRRARAVGLGAVSCIGRFMSLVQGVQGVQVCRMCRHGRASFFFSLPSSLSLSFFFSKEKGASCLQSCKPARFLSVSLCTRRAGRALAPCTLPAQSAPSGSWCCTEVVQVRRSPVKTQHLSAAIGALAVQNAHGVQRWLHAAQRIHERPLGLRNR